MGLRKIGRVSRLFIGLPMAERSLTTLIREDQSSGACAGLCGRINRKKNTITKVPGKRHMVWVVLLNASFVRNFPKTGSLRLSTLITLRKKLMKEIQKDSFRAQNNSRLREFKLNFYILIFENNT